MGGDIITRAGTKHLIGEEFEKDYSSGCEENWWRSVGKCTELSFTNSDH